MSTVSIQNNVSSLGIQVTPNLIMFHFLKHQYLSPTYKT